MGNFVLDIQHGFHVGKKNNCFQDSVIKLRVEYERSVDQFTSARSKLDEQKAKGSKRTDEYKDKLLKVTSCF